MCLRLLSTPPAKRFLIGDHLSLSRLGARITSRKDARPSATAVVEVVEGVGQEDGQWETAVVEVGEGVK